MSLSAIDTKPTEITLMYTLPGTETFGFFDYTDPVQIRVTGSGSYTSITPPAYNHNELARTISFGSLPPSTSFDFIVKIRNQSVELYTLSITTSTITPSITVTDQNWSGADPTVTYTSNIAAELAGGKVSILYIKQFGDASFSNGSGSATFGPTTVTLSGISQGTVYLLKLVGIIQDENGQPLPVESNEFTLSYAAWQAKQNAGAVPCFFGDAPVLTPSGYRRMDSLREGDIVSTPGGPAAIERVKVYRCAAGPTTNPYVIPKGQFGATRRLLISPNHRVATANGMVEAQHLGLRQEERTGELTYYNLALPGWANMTVAGVEVESLAPVQHITVPLAVFTALVAKKYGAVTPAVLAQIKRTCRFLENGHVECPVLKK